MSNIPDFASASYPEIKAGAPSPASETETWMTNEQIPVPPTYSLGVGSVVLEALVGDEWVVTDSSWRAQAGDAGVLVVFLATTA